ncbi:MAG: lysophospholipid acyltransferase family protein [Clostridia bacterium]|nr:lysophospholipid acyltransferase family protein [Clostridia bacterium]
MEKIKEKVWKIFNTVIFSTLIKIDTENIYHINSATEPIIFICNHLSNFDAVALNRVLSVKNPYYVSGIKLSKNKKTNFVLDFFKTIKIKPESVDIQAIKKIIEVVKNGDNVVIFPEGTRSRTKALIEGKRGTAYVAIKTNATIIPIGITGTEKVLPINDNDMGAEKLHCGKIKIKFGKPYKIPKKNPDISKKQFEAEITDYMMNSIAELLPEEYRGFYA